MNRRVFISFLLSTASASSFSTSSLAQQNPAIGAKELFDKLVAIGSSDIVSGLGALGTVYGIYSDRLFQTAVINSLERIERALSEINRKLDIIVGLLRDLPNVFAQVLEIHEQRKLSQEIYSYHERILVYARSYPDPTRLPAAEARILREQVFEPLIHSISTLRQWGAGGYFSVGFGFSTAAIAARWLDLNRAQFDALRDLNIRYLVAASASFDQLAKESRRTLQINSEVANSHHGFVILTPTLTDLVRRNYPKADFTPEFVFVDQHLVQLKGDFEQGFAYDRRPANGSELFSVTDSQFSMPTHLYSRARNWRKARYTSLLDYSMRGSEKDRLIALLGTLNNIVFAGHEARRMAPIYESHSLSAQYIAELIRSIRY